jgi:hypothetical protein
MNLRNIGADFPSRRRVETRIAKGLLFGRKVRKKPRRDLGEQLILLVGAR